MNKKQANISDSLFSTVISMVNDGWNIRAALKKLEIDITKFYKEITIEQKILLGEAKTANTKYGVGSQGCKNIFSNIKFK